MNWLRQHTLTFAYTTLRDGSYAYSKSETDSIVFLEP
jgi:hypothetical protein